MARKSVSPGFAVLAVIAAVAIVVIVALQFSIPKLLVLCIVPVAVLAVLRQRHSHE